MSPPPTGGGGVTRGGRGREGKLIFLGGGGGFQFFIGFSREGADVTNRGERGMERKKAFQIMYVASSARGRTYGYEN